MRVAAAAGTLVAALALAAPASAATPVIAAFDKHVTGNGFDIGLVNAATGRTLAVPSSVNTAADEFHPALSPNGRFLVFTRTTLVPQPDGDVVPPATRSVLMLDRQTGAIRAPFSGRGFEAAAGATIVPTAGSSVLAYGLRVQRTQADTDPAVIGGSFSAGSYVANSFAGATPFRLGVVPGQDLAGTFNDVPHAAVGIRNNRFIKAISFFRFSEGTGDISAARTRLIDQPLGAFTPNSSLDLPLNAVPRHATPRVGDGHVALDTLTTAGTDIHTIQFPGDSATSPMPFPVFSALDERMPAWSPDGVQLGFVRTTEPTSPSPRRRLLLFDSTVGVQDIVNPALDLGVVAPTFKLRAFQDTWGALSLANPSEADTVVVTCGLVCSGGISGSTDSVTLSPTLTTSRIVKVGIIIGRVVGTRRLFGRRVPRVRNVGRVPLGRTSSRRPRFRWNGRIRGRRLARGRYLLTFRTLNRRNRVLSTSRSIRFTVTADGRLTRARPA
jgi:hypothetical protein